MNITPSTTPAPHAQPAFPANATPAAQPTGTADDSVEIEPSVIAVLGYN